MTKTKGAPFYLEHGVYRHIIRPTVRTYGWKIFSKAQKQFFKMFQNSIQNHLFATI